MLETPAGAPASPADMQEAASLVEAITAGEHSVVDELVADLAAGIRSRPLVVTAADELAAQAAEYWLDSLLRAGVAALQSADTVPGDAAARIHLHGGNSAAADYAGAVIDGAGGELVGDVIGQGRSAVARYQTLAVVGDALAAELRQPAP